MNITQYLFKFNNGSAYNSWANSQAYVYPSVCIYGNRGNVVYNNSSTPLLIML